MQFRKQGSTSPLQWIVNRDLSGVDPTVRLVATHPVPGAPTSYNLLGTVVSSTSTESVVEAALPADIPPAEYLAETSFPLSGADEVAPDFGYDLVVVTPAL